MEGRGRGSVNTGSTAHGNPERRAGGADRPIQGVMCNIPGQTKLVEHHIDTPGTIPIRLPAYRLPHAYRDIVKQELKEMVAHGIIEPSVSEWASLMVVVPKKDGAFRLCVDYRRLNAMSKADAYPMPWVDELIIQLGRAKYISMLDLTKGYWQVPVAKEVQHKTAFTTPFGLYQFRRMPFGLQGAPATFQQLMDRLVEHCREFTGAYLDDLVVFSET